VSTGLPPSSGLSWEEKRSEVHLLQWCPLALRIPPVSAGAVDSAAASADAADSTAVEAVMVPLFPGVHKLRAG
jgi:hypothetical protein